MSKQGSNIWRLQTVIKAPDGDGTAAGLSWRQILTHSLEGLGNIRALSFSFAAVIWTL